MQKGVQADKPAGQVSRLSRILRLAAFFLCPVYIVWSFKLGSGNLFAWPGAELGAFLVLTVLWCAAWGFAALAYVRRARLARRRYQELVERGLILEEGSRPYDPEESGPAGRAAGENAPAEAELAAAPLPDAERR